MRKSKDALALPLQMQTLGLRRAAANVDFIGELYKAGVLSSHVLHFCFTALLSPDMFLQPDGDLVTLLCRLMTSVASHLCTEVMCCWCACVNVCMYMPVSIKMYLCEPVRMYIYIHAFMCGCTHAC